MIRLKQLLYEDTDPIGATGPMIDGFAPTDPWQYWKNTDNTNWYTKRKKSTTWLDMRIALFDKYKEDEATTRWSQATTKLDKWVNDNPDGYKKITVPINKIETYEPVPDDLQKQLAHPLQIDYHDISTAYEYIEMDDAVFKAKVKRNSPLEIIEVTPDNKYYRVKLPHRFFKKNYDIYVNVNEFDLSKKDNKFIGTYNGKYSKFEIYRPKQKVSNTKTNSSPVDSDDKVISDEIIIKVPKDGFEFGITNNKEFAKLQRVLIELYKTSKFKDELKDYIRLKTNWPTGQPTAEELPIAFNYYIGNFDKFIKDGADGNYVVNSALVFGTHMYMLANEPYGNFYHDKRVKDYIDDADVPNFPSLNQLPDTRVTQFVLHANKILAGQSKVKVITESRLSYKPKYMTMIQSKILQEQLKTSYGKKSFSQLG